jgi:hypothetical protein
MKDDYFLYLSKLRGILPFLRVDREQSDEKAENVQGNERLVNF